MLTARVDDYLWHTGRELQARWEEGQIELIRWSWPRGLRGELRKIDTLTRKGMSETLKSPPSRAKRQPTYYSMTLLGLWRNLQRLPRL
jgi:hypothetical protein